MAKRSISLAILSAIILTTATVSAEVIQTQSPIYKDDIGRMHFMGKGGYSSIRPMQMGEAYSGAVNEAVDKYSNAKSELEAQAKQAKEDAQKAAADAEKRAEQIQREVEDGFEFTTSKAKQAETDITNVIKEKPVVPASSFKSSYSAQKAPLDASRHQGYNTNIPAGVNDSKTIYTDELGRLHFFGKGNIIKE